MPNNSDKIRIRLMRAAEGYLTLGMPDHALRELARIEDPGNDLFGICLLKGEALRIKHEHESALEAFRQAHLEKPTDLVALMGMAWCLKRTNQLPLAIDMMKLAHQFRKDVSVVLYNLSCYYSLAGDKDNALSWLGRALRMDFKLLKLIPAETDFDSFRNDVDFQHLLELTLGQKNA